MIQLKTPEEMDKIRIACYKLRDWMEQAVINLANGGTYKNGLEVSQELTSYVASLGDQYDTCFDRQTNRQGEPFGFPTCISVNDAIVHGRPDKKPFKLGDIIKVDAGLTYEGWHADMARTVVFGHGLDMDGVSKEIKRLIYGCYEALNVTQRYCNSGNTLETLSMGIHLVSKRNKLASIVDYMGHCIGKELHEEPRISNMPGLFPRYDEIVLRPGFVFCLEPMMTLGTNNTVIGQDGWKVWTQDASLSAHFENQIMITEEGPEFLTTLSIDHCWEEK